MVVEMEKAYQKLKLFGSCAPGQSLRASPTEMFNFPNIRYGPVMSSVMVASLWGLVAIFYHLEKKALCFETLDKSLVRYGRNEYGAITVAV